jgi:glycosyltransferase involved in cell wall biosynthesis
MSTYNESEDYIRSSVSSILRQTLHDLELIIVIDNPENEAAVTAVNAFASEDSRVIILRNERNLGLVRSLNKAITAARGEILARMDADDISMPQRLEKQLAFMEHEQFDIVGAVTQYIDENGMPVAGGHTYKTEKQLKRILQFENGLCHPTWMVRREVYEQLDGYRDIDSCEDYDFLLRALEKGYRLGIIDEVLLYYRYNLNGISQSREFRQFLAFSYLSEHRDSPSAVSEEEIRNYVNNNMTTKNQQDYERAKAFFLQSKKQPGRLSRVCFLMRAGCASRFFRKRLLNSLRKRGI